MTDEEKPIGIIVAVEEELRAILKRMSPAVVDSVGRIRIHRGQLSGKSVNLTKSGMGVERAEFCASTFISATHPRALIIGGFCGGLLNEPGELFIPDVVLDDRRKGVGDALEPNGKMLALAGRTAKLKAAGAQRKLLTTGQILRTKLEKQLACRDARSFHAVDMETYGAAEAAERAEIPWIAVRAVSDGQQDEMPLDFSRFTDSSGEVQRGRVALAVLMRPWVIPAMIRLGACSSLAARNLAEFVERYVAEL